MGDRIVFVVAESDVSLCQNVANLLKASFEGAVVFMANDGAEALAKMQNSTPRLLVTGLDLGKKMSGIELCQRMDQDKKLDALPILVLSDVPDSADFVDDRASGRMKFLSVPIDQETFVSSVKNMLNMETIKSNEFNIVKLEAGASLFKEGDVADCAYLLKSGKLQAARTVEGKTVPLGEVLAGEFVGEMAHINGENRLADVTALEHSELVKIPLGTLDLLVFSKPTWTKALMKTLTRRLREANMKKK